MLINQPKGVKPKMRGHKDRSCENQNGTLKGKSSKTDERKTRARCIGSCIIRLSNRIVSFAVRSLYSWGQSTKCSWALQPVWTLWQRRGKIPASAGNRILLFQSVASHYTDWHRLIRYTVVMLGVDICVDTWFQW